MKWAFRANFTSFSLLYEIFLWKTHEICRYSCFYDRKTEWVFHFPLNERNFREKKNPSTWTIELLFKQKDKKKSHVRHPIIWISSSTVLIETKKCHQTYFTSVVIPRIYSLSSKNWLQKCIRKFVFISLSEHENSLKIVDITSKVDRI